MISRIAVLASGGGSNLQALLDYLDSLGDDSPGEVVAVISDRPTAGALERARAHDIPACSIAKGADGAAELFRTLHDASVDLVVLAGYLRLVPPAVVHHYDGRLVNIHPALLPAFGGEGMYGLHVHQAVLDAGVRVTGATVHLVTEEYDRGSILAQWPVPVFPHDDAATLAARVLQVEHWLYPRVIHALAGRGEIVLDGAPPFSFTEPR
ncbi:MAG: phosphoribosylglycinamide formyltransferase [Gemmatimonadetes bacterium]|nr:phosphoribosylglycinamide formyltransferase [Gemmatimonadota bacterium]